MEGIVYKSIQKFPSPNERHHQTRLETSWLRSCKVPDRQADAGQSIRLGGGLQRAEDHSCDRCDNLSGQ